MSDRVFEMESRQLAQQLDMLVFDSPTPEFPVPTGADSPGGGKWSIVMEEMWFPCFGSYPNLQVHASEEDARAAFETLKAPRVLLDELGNEVLAACGAPWKKYALRMIRQKLLRNHYALPCSKGRQQLTDELCEMADLDFSDNEFFNSDEFSNSGLAVQLPRKNVPSDMVSTVGDLGSSRTSNFTIATLESRSSENVPPVVTTPLATGKSHSLRDECALSNDSVDICQSTTSSVYRLLDIDSRSGSVIEDL
jgi:hypothetical protein